MRFLTPDTPVQLAIADGATTPDPGVTGAMAWSTTTGTFVRWSGSAWQIVGPKDLAGSLFWETPTNKTLTLSAKAAFAFTLNQIRGLKTSAGTLTLSVKINGTDVTGLASLSVTSSAQDATATAANAVAAGDRITVVIASVSSAANLEFTLKGTR